MPRRRRRRRTRDRRARRERLSLFSQLSDGAKRGLVFVALSTASVLIMLSAFGSAGTVGAYIDSGMALAFGWMRLVAALALVVVAAGIIMPNSQRITPWTYIGLLLFFLSANGLINTFAFQKQPLSERALMAAGGYIGLPLQQLGASAAGYWGTVTILAALILIAFVLMFHPVWRDLFIVIERWRDARAEDGDEDDAKEEADEVAHDGDDDERPRRITGAFSKRGASARSEEALTVPRRRKKRIALPLDLLEDRSLKPDSGDIERNSELIETTFGNFSIPVEVMDVSVGPTVTQYAVRPADGIKLSRIVGLQNDLALALAAHPIRIEAPIPGKSLVGIEVPNKSIATVSLRSILESSAFKKSAGVLNVALGMDVSGKAWVTELERAPHMLVAGATGSGKSVCLNGLIVSLLYQLGPDELKLILIDPKRVELPVYAGIPHLLVPPITKAEDAINALKWTVREMERRLDVLSATGARNISAYNKKAEEQMPYVVVVIDELADLMATSSRDVEALVVRIAQMARAVGIHLVLATQRPSVDIITGTIKANIPTRLAFAVASQTDSRTIMDYAGAEKLLGRGDMLYVSAELPKARRLQGAFLSDAEIKRVVDALKQEEAPNYNYDVLETRAGGTVLDVAGEEEPLLEEAIEALLAAGKASTSLLQRRLKIGYSRAARIIDLLEEQGIVGPQEGAKPRRILIDSMADLQGERAEGDGEIEGDSQDDSDELYEDDEEADDEDDSDEEENDEEEGDENDDGDDEDEDEKNR